MKHTVTTFGQKGGVTAANVTIDRGGQHSLFDAAEGNQRKERGLARASASKTLALQFIRLNLTRLFWERAGQQPGLAYVTADDAREMLRRFYMGIDPPKGGNNFLGSVFRDGKWEMTGQYVKSKVPGNNARRIPCWRLRPEGRVA